MLIDYIRAIIRPSFIFNPTRDQIDDIHIKNGTVKAAGNGYSSFPYGSSLSGQKWPGGLSSKNSAPIKTFDHASIMQHARDAMYDSVEARALQTSITDTVVDVGLTWKPAPDVSILGLTPEQGEEWGRVAGSRFHLWAQSKKSDRRRINNFYQNQRQWQWFSGRDNDVFARLYYGRDKDQINPLQIDFIDPTQIRGAAYTSTYSQFPHDDGIIRDGAGREIGYRIWNYDKDMKYTETTIPAVGEKSGRIMMIHGFRPEYAGQGRGFSKIAHMIQELSDLTDFKASTIQKAINQASFVGAVENEHQDASQPLVGQTAGVVAQYGSTPTPAADAQNVTDAALEPVVSWDVNPEASIRQPGSMMIGNLKRGDKLKFLEDTSPSAQFDKYVVSVFSFLAAASGWAIELVLKKFNANYSASRGTLLLCWRTATIERNEMISDFLDPVLEMWLSEEIAAGRISCPGWSDPVLRAAWLAGTWAGVPIPNINPKDAAEADRLYVEMGATTLDDIAENYNGSSGAANRAALNRQYSELPNPPWSKNVPSTKRDDDNLNDEKSDEGNNI